jgi:hypothetical protein
MEQRYARVSVSPSARTAMTVSVPMWWAAHRPVEWAGGVRSSSRRPPRRLMRRRSRTPDTRKSGCEGISVVLTTGPRHGPVTQSCCRRTSLEGTSRTVFLRLSHSVELMATSTTTVSHHGSRSFGQVGQQIRRPGAPVARDEGRRSRPPVVRTVLSANVGHATVGEPRQSPLRTSDSGVVHGREWRDRFKGKDTSGGPVRLYLHSIS